MNFLIVQEMYGGKLVSDPSVSARLLCDLPGIVTNDGVSPCVSSS